MENGGKGITALQLVIRKNMLNKNQDKKYC